MTGRISSEPTRIFGYRVLSGIRGGDQACSADTLHARALQFLPQLRVLLALKSSTLCVVINHDFFTNARDRQSTKLVGRCWLAVAASRRSKSITPQTNNAVGAGRPGSRGRTAQ